MSIATTTLTQTVGALRTAGFRRVLVTCPGCSHFSVLHAGNWSAHLQLTDVAAKLICHVCGKVGAALSPAAPIVVVWSGNHEKPIRTDSPSAVLATAPRGV